MLRPAWRCRSSRRRASGRILAEQLGEHLGVERDEVVLAHPVDGAEHPVAHVVGRRVGRAPELERAAPRRRRGANWRVGIRPARARRRGEDERRRARDQRAVEVEERRARARRRPCWLYSSGSHVSIVPHRCLHRTRATPRAVDRRPALGTPRSYATRRATPRRGRRPPRRRATRRRRARRATRADRRRRRAAAVDAGRAGDDERRTRRAARRASIVAQRAAHDGLVAAWSAPGDGDRAVGAERRRQIGERAQHPVRRLVDARSCAARPPARRAAPGAPAPDAGQEALEHEATGGQPARHERVTGAAGPGTAVDLVTRRRARPAPGARPGR